MTDIEREWQYRYNEALSLGRTEKQARIESDEWRKKIEHETKTNRTNKRTETNPLRGSVWVAFIPA